MKKSLIILAVFISMLLISVQAFDYVPKDTNSNPFTNSKQDIKNNVAKVPERREIKNLSEYFKYIPAEVHRNWKPYKANVDYEITVEFRVNRDGSVSDLQIVKSNYPKANSSVLNAVQLGAPYQPLPKTYTNESVKAQIVLEFHK